MDRRQRKTREAIFRAFTGLLARKSYSRITVQDIISEADVGRATFYAHFETKDDLLRTLCADVFEHVFSEDLGKERTHDFSKEHNTAAVITHILYHLQEHMAYLPGILSGEGGEIFMAAFKEQLKGVFAHSGLRPDSPVPHAYLLNHMVCDFAETVRWWARNSQYTPEEISTFFLETTPLFE